MRMNSALIGVGSNISPEENVVKAEKEVSLLGRSIRKSRFVYTQPLLYEKQDDFLNGVFRIETPYEYKELNDKLKKIEDKLGRVRTENKCGPRTIDLDTVIYNNQVKDVDAFSRDFIKTPVIELLPGLEDILNCCNYKNNFETVSGIIEKILYLLTLPPESVFGAGNWFCNVESPADSIDIFVIIENTGNGNEEIIKRELISSGLSKIGSCPVHVRLFRLEDLKVLAAGKYSEAETPDFLRSVVSQFPSYKLLYGNHRLLPKALL